MQAHIFRRSWHDFAFDHISGQPLARRDLIFLYRHCSGRDGKLTIINSAVLVTDVVSPKCPGSLSFPISLQMRLDSTNLSSGQYLWNRCVSHLLLPI